MIKEFLIWCNTVYIVSIIFGTFILTLYSLCINEYGIRDPNISIKETMNNLFNDLTILFIGRTLICIILFIAPFCVFLSIFTLIIKTVINALFYIPFKEEDKEKEEN